MWKNFGNTSTKIKMFAAIALLVGVGVTTYIAMGIDNGDGSGEPSLTVPNGDAGGVDSTKATESKVEPKGVTEVTEPDLEGDADGGSLSSGDSYGGLAAQNASRGGTRMLFGESVGVNASQNVVSSNTGTVSSVQVVSVSSDGAVERVELAVNQGDNAQVVEQKKVEVDKSNDVKKDDVSEPNKEEDVKEGEGEEIAKVDTKDEEDSDGSLDGDVSSTVPVGEDVNGDVESGDVVSGGVVDENDGKVTNGDEQDSNNGEESEEERLVREEAERQAREEQERKEREEADRLAREEAERIAREEEERRKELENAGNVAYVPVNDYPWQNVCPSQADDFLTTVNTPSGVQKLGGYVCECVSYAAWKVYINYGVLANWGNANTWDNNARNLGYRVDNVPEAGAVGQTDDGYYGHVFWVEYVNEDGSIVISDYNDWQSTKAYFGSGHGWDFGLMTVPARYVSQYNYIHFK